MDKTLKDVRIARPQKTSVAKVFRGLLELDGFPNHRIPDERTIARWEKLPISQVDALFASGYLTVLGTTLEAEAPELVEEFRSLADLLERQYAWIYDLTKPDEKSLTNAA